jgi:ABC-type Mn2+/Zn2+ transport system permease subunit
MKKRCDEVDLITSFLIFPVFLAVLWTRRSFPSMLLFSCLFQEILLWD